MENGGEKIIKINIEEEMKSSYIDYSMSCVCFYLSTILIWHW